MGSGEGVFVFFGGGGGGGKPLFFFKKGGPMLPLFFFFLGGGGGGGENPYFFQKRVAKFGPVLIFLGSVSSQACLLGYTFNGPVQNCRKLSRNLPWEARHFFATLQIKKKKKLWQQPILLGPPVFSSSIL